MTENLGCTSATTGPARTKFFPGYLLTPFGWAAQPLIGMVEADPTLLRQLFELNRPDMHLIALGLAHLEADAVPKIGPVLVRCSSPHALTHILGRPPVGIKQVLKRLPFAVLTAENYRRLVVLLEDPSTGKLVLQHSETDLDDLSGVMICLGLPVRKHFLHGTISLDGRPSDRRSSNVPRSEKASP